MMNQQTVDISYVSNELVIERLPRTIWPIFPLFFIFCYGFGNYKRLGKN